PRSRPPSTTLFPYTTLFRSQLQEWGEDYEEAEPHHRHISHLYALYPGEDITAQATPELFQAARVSLERRLAAGGGYTGWSRAWRSEEHTSELRSRENLVCRL